MDRTTDKYMVNVSAAKMESFDTFKKWHKHACSSDKLTAEERYVKLGGKLPSKTKKE